LSIGTKMYYLKHILTITILSSLLSFPAHSSVSPDGVWSDVTSRSAMSKTFNYRSVNASAAELVNQLRNAPLEGTTSQGLEFFLPLPNGGFERVSAFESPIMAPELAAKLPNLKTYKVTGLDNPLVSGRLDASPEGFHGFLNTEQGVVYIEPEASYSPNGSKETYRSFNKLNFPSAKHEFKCSVIGHEHGDSPIQSLAHNRLQTLAMRSSGTSVRTYRLALAATAEYTKAVSSTEIPSVPEAQAAIVTAINRINAIYEKEVAIKFSLVDNSNIVFTDAAADGYSNDDGYTLLSENKAKLDLVITPAGYDIGHVFSTGGGGVASIASVCDDARKAQGVTGLYNPIGDPFVVDYVAHEIGHQFGAPHTFNSGGDDSGACDDSNRENHQSTVGGTQLSDSAYEPGSGSTIMAYAGICNPQNLQNNTDPYFHARSLEQIREFVENEILYSETQGGSCGTIEQTGNTPPSAEAGNNYTIPANTPFALTASGDDVDSADIATLNYTWEQFDLGSKTTSLAALHTDSDTRPIVRSRQGTSSPTRYIPALDAILENNLTKHVGERLPTTDRDLKFRLTVRSGAAGFNQDDMIVTVDKDAGPFRVIEPAASEFSGASQLTVSWDVANTQLPPVNCSHMNILYSSDGGESFSQTLSTSTPNDGNQQITLPNTATNAARIKVECSDNIFFNVSPENFTVNPTSLLNISSDSTNNNEGDSKNSSFIFSITRSGNFVGASSVSYSVSGTGGNPATAEDFIGNTFPNGSVNFADGESTKIVTINIAGDLLVEPDEGFIVMLSNPESASITTATVMGVITNDDESLSISAAAESKAEGNSGSTAYNFNVVRAGNISGSSTANYTVTSTGDSPATTADFIGNTFPSGSVSFADGESTKTVTINVAGDLLVEPDEGFIVMLSNPESASITTATAMGVITNDDESLSISAAAESKAEGNSGSTAYNFNVIRSGNISGSSTASYTVTSTGDSPATTADFIGNIFPSGTVTFSDGEFTQIITVNIAGDTRFESNESFTVSLSNPISASIITANAEGTIMNDDAKPEKDSSGGGSGGLLFTLLLPLLLMRRKH
jgi:hypothetical protein